MRTPAALGPRDRVYANVCVGTVQVVATDAIRSAGRSGRQDPRPTNRRTFTLETIERAQRDGAAESRRPASVRSVDTPGPEERLAVLGTVALAVGLRSWLIGVRPLWVDEAYSLGLAGRPIRDILAFLRVADAHPIGYYALLAAWTHRVGTGLAWARLPSLVFGMTAVLLTWWIGRQMFSRAAGVIAAALVTLNPFQIIASNEIRMYPMLECAALTSTWLLYLASRRARVLWMWAAYGASLAMAAYTSYYAFLLLPAHALWIARSRPSCRPIAGLAIAAGVALALYAPWIPYAVAGLRRGVPWRPAMSLDEFMSTLSSQVVGGYLLGTGTYQARGGTLPPFAHGMLLAPFLGLMTAGVIPPSRANRTARLLVGLSWAVPLVAVLAGSVATGQAVAYPRHLVFLEPFAALLLAGGIERLRTAVRAAPRALTVPLAGMLVSAFLYPAVAQANPTSWDYRYDRASEFVSANYRPGDATIFFPADAGLAFRYYFAPPGEQIFVVPDRRRWSREGFRTPIHRAVDIVVSHRCTRVWIVYSGPWPRGSLGDLVQALHARGYRWGPQHDFRWLWVVLLTRS